MIIKNQTPYIGEIRLKFENDPEYSGDTILNNIHWDLGFTKLVSRMKPNRTKNQSWQVDYQKILLINENTGLTVKDYWFDDMEPREEYTTYNACLNPDGIFVGDIVTGWNYYKLGLVSKAGTHPSVAFSESEQCWVGFGHRAIQSFQIGDKLFDPAWIPTDDELIGLEKYYVKNLDKYEAEVEAWEHSESSHKAPEKEMTMNAWATSYIPFTLHGSKTIETLDEACQAATNFVLSVR